MASPNPNISPIIRFYDPDIQSKDARGRNLETILSWSNSELERCHDYIQMLFPLPEGSPFNFSAPVIDLEVMRAFRARSELRSRLGQSFDRMMDFYGFTTLYTPETNTSELSDKNDEEVELDTQGETSTEHNTQTQQATVVVEGSSKEVNPDVPTVEVKEDTNANIATLDATESHEEKPAAIDNDTTKTDTTSTTSAQPPPSTYSIVRGPNWNRASRNWCVRFDHNHLRITRILRSLRVLGLQKEYQAFFAALKDVHADPEFSISDRSMMYWRRAVERPLYLAPDDEEIDWLQMWEEQQQQQQQQQI